MKINTLMAKIIYGEDYKFFMSGAEIAEDNRKERDQEQTIKFLEEGQREIENYLNKKNVHNK